MRCQIDLGRVELELESGWNHSRAGVSNCLWGLTLVSVWIEFGLYNRIQGRIYIFKDSDHGQFQTELSSDLPLL